MEDCGARIRRTVRFHGPDRPAGLGVTGARKGRARLVWSPSGPATGAWRDTACTGTAAPTGASAGASLRVRAGRAHGYRVAATDTRGNVGPQSNPVRVVRGHRAPGAPGRLRATRVTRLGGAPVVVGRQAAQRAHRRLPHLPRRRAGAPGARLRRRRSQPRARHELPVHRRRGRHAGIHERRHRAGVGHDRAAGGHAGTGARLPARVHRRELPRPPAPLPPDRHRVPDLLRVPRRGRRGHRRATIRW